MATSFKPPKVPKTPKVDPAKAGDKAKKQADAAKKKAAKQAQGQAKARLKKLLKILIVLLIVAIIALVVWLVIGRAPAPTTTVEAMINAAFLEDEDKFKSHFTPDSVTALESAWSGSDVGTGVQRGSWSRMMKGILTEDGLKPKILEEAVEGEKATVQVDIDGTKRSIELVMVDDTWLIDVNQGVNPNLIIPPEELDEAVADEFEVGEPENEMWWEEREAAKAKEAEKKKGCLGCSISSGPAWSDAALWGGLLLLLGSLSWRQRTHERLSKGYATKRANARCQLPVEANHMSAHRASTKAARCGPRGVQS